MTYRTSVWVEDRYKRVVYYRLVLVQSADDEEMARNLIKSEAVTRGFDHQTHTFHFGPVTRSWREA